LHEFEIKSAARDGRSPRFVGRIDPDPWTIVHGAMEVSIETAFAEPGPHPSPLPAYRERGSDCDRSAVTGTYTGTFAGEAISGEFVATFERDIHASRGVSQTKPAILDHFEQTGPAGLLYDFSYAGRGTTDPSASLPVIDARDFGVNPDSGEEAAHAIQRAIDEAARIGGAVVQLPAGVIDVNVDQKHTPIHIRHSNIVLRGAGSGPDGTLLVNHRYSDTPDPKKPWLAGDHPLIRIGTDEAEPTPLTRITAGERGELSFDVDDASAIRTGEIYLLRHLEDADGSLARDLVQNRVEVASNWRGEGKELVSQIVEVKQVEGNRITVDAPLHRSVTRWRAELCAMPMLRNCGVSSMHIRGRWGGYFVHHKSGEHDNGWDHVRLIRVAHGWVSDIVHENATTAVSMRDALGCVVSGCRIIGNPGHNAYNIIGRSTGNLVIGCHAARNMHAFNVQGTVSGNAIVDCTMDEPSGVDLHGGIGCDNLYDALVGGVNKGGGSTGAVPPRHGPGFVLWNWCCGEYDPYKPWQRYLKVAEYHQVPGFIAIGIHSAYGTPLVYRGPDGDVRGPFREPWGWVESPNQRVSPRSLYAWQKQRRGGDRSD
jgi:hypothetical protein